MYHEILAGCLQLHAKRLVRASNTHSEPDGWQARAQAAKARKLAEWSRDELANARTKRDFEEQRLSKEEITSAVAFCEDEIANLDSSMRQELEKLGPLEEIGEPDGSAYGVDSPELEEALREKLRNGQALFYLKSAMEIMNGEL